jgi:hypothetical protein
VYSGRNNCTSCTSSPGRGMVMRLDACDAIELLRTGDELRRG